MISLTTAQLLTVWERGLNQTKVQRVLELLSMAYPEFSYDDAAKLSIGERDSRLLQLRKRLFGSRLACTDDCPLCSERVEWVTDVDEICSESSWRLDSTDSYTLDIDGFMVSYRLPNSDDISAIIENGVEGANTDNLLTRCILDSRHNGEVCDTDGLPERVRQALVKQIEAEDSLADVSMLLDCPSCSHRWEVQFDIADYIWTEINNWAERTFTAVHRLAAAYGWSQEEILSMSPTRRQIYLEMVI